MKRKLFFAIGCVAFIAIMASNPKLSRAEKVKPVVPYVCLNDLDCPYPYPSAHLYCGGFIFCTRGIDWINCDGMIIRCEDIIVP